MPDVLRCPSLPPGLENDQMEVPASELGRSRRGKNCELLAEPACLAKNLPAFAMIFQAARICCMHMIAYEQHPKGFVHTSLCESNNFVEIIKQPVKRYYSEQPQAKPFHSISCMVFLGLAISSYIV